MSRLRRQLDEDRALRDSARAVFRKELAHVRQDIAPQALGERVADRVGERIDAASDDAIGFARKRGGAIAAAGGAIASAVGLWFGRKPLFSRIEAWFGHDNEIEQIADEVPDEDQDDE
jgi:hypothetical protein